MKYQHSVSFKLFSIKFCMCGKKSVLSDHIVHLKSPGTKLASIYIKRASTSLISLALLYLYYYARFMCSLARARACKLALAFILALALAFTLTLAFILALALAFILALALWTFNCACSS